MRKTRENSLINTTVKGLVNVRSQTAGSSVFSIKICIIFALPALCQIWTRPKIPFGLAWNHKSTRLHVYVVAFVLHRASLRYKSQIRPFLELYLLVSLSVAYTTWERRHEGAVLLCPDCFFLSLMKLGRVESRLYLRVQPERWIPQLPGYFFEV